MAIAIRLEILADGPRSGTETFAPSLLTTAATTVFSPGDTPLELTWTLTQVAYVVELSAHLRGELRYGCARCADALIYPVDLAISHHWVPAGELQVDAGDGDPEFDRDPDISEHDGCEIDLEPIVIECATVDLPFSPDCEVSTSGPCPTWSDVARVLHPGGEAPDIQAKNPFAALADLEILAKKHTSN